ncbi:hypothetical protein BS50DRAFT_578221 [Corynespora cassiicola Philippines]|uniref:Dipeptidyl-peptidase V n=1 Tax=Corynespora cassiicola Philippines TaxID=1448308 RepID=A0A2T2N8A9_CORCC|nr:hypothetical protein BS50DRAFT_578221 [Corynespora cassiicola Philippines]
MARYLGIATALAATGVFAITPEQMLSAPRRGVASPAPNGEIALLTTTQYSFEEQSTSVAWQVLDLKTGNISDSGLTSDVNEVVWLPGTETGIIYINGTNEQVPGGVTIWIGDLKKPSESTLVASLDAPFSGLKVANTSSGNLNFLVNSLAYKNGSAYNPELVPKPRHTGQLYENIYPRHWDTWLTPERYAVFAGTLLANSSYGLAHTGLRNLLHGINYTATRPETPVQPFGDAGDYDISPDGAVYAFLSKATHLNKANYTASYIYVGPFDGSALATPFNGPDSEASEAGHQGASGQPTFSPDSSKLAYVQQDEDYYESDRWQLYVIDVASDAATSNLKPLTAGWDRSVSSIHWAPNGESIYVSAEDYAITRAFNVPLSADESFVPKNLTAVTSVTGFSVLADETLLVSSTSVWTSRDYYLLATDGTKTGLFSATDVDAELAGLGPHTYSEFFHNGSLPDFDQQLHALVVKPSNYVANKTYPLAFIIHGGPQGANSNAWSTRWNWQVWADQGYIVIGPNPTGSTGFGQYLTDAIQGNWGSYPYEDLVLAYEYAKENFPEIDFENGIAAGASYGGYMTNWIQGHALGREFKALVTHDGISNTLGAYSSEELWFIRHDYNGTVYESDAYNTWNPMNHIANWSTPQFVVHNTLDYRLPESDGLALFNILQSKGIPSRFLNFPDENHWVLKAENSLFWHQEIFNWINHYSKGEEFDTLAIGE